MIFIKVVITFVKTTKSSFEANKKAKLSYRGKKMSKLRLIPLLIFALMVIGAVQTDDDPPGSTQEYKYIGTDACVICHKTEKQGKQLDIWKNSKHAQAYNTLLSDEANQICEELELETPAHENTLCLRCHASGYDIDPANLGGKFRIEDGVQCETCHGPGSGYKDLKTMQNREEALKNGLIIHENLEEYCVKCHNPESPTYVAIDIEAAWMMIAHPTPKKTE